MTVAVAVEAGRLAPDVAQAVLDELATVAATIEGTAGIAHTEIETAHERVTAHVKAGKTPAVRAEEVAPIVQREENARAAFIETAREMHNLSVKDAERLLQTYREQKLVKLDRGVGRYVVKSGDLWDADRVAVEIGRTYPAASSGRRVKELPLDALHSDPARFQPRGAAFSEESANRVATEFDANLFEPVVVWADPSDGETYVLAGHSRFEGFKRRAKADRSVTSIPVRYFDGTEKEARRFAATENDKGTQLANHERASYLRSMRADGASVADVEAEARRLYKRDAATVVALSYLSPTGKALDALSRFKNGTDEARDAETMGTWIGKIRRSYPQLTDSHERELFELVLANFKTTGRRFSSFSSFGDFVGQRIERRTIFGAIDGPLNFAEIPAASRTELEVDETIRAAERELKAAENTLRTRRRGYIERGADGAKLERALKKERDAVAVATRDLLALRQRRDATVGGIRASELSLFANGPEALAAYGATGLERGELSEALAYFGRAMQLTSKLDTEEGRAYYSFDDESGATHLLYDPRDATLYLVPDVLVRADTGAGWDGIEDAVAREAAEGLQASFHGFVPGRETFAVTWPDPATVGVAERGTATRIRYLSDKLHASETLPGGPLPAGTITTGERGVPRGFEHRFTDSLPVLRIGEGERAVTAVRGVLVTDDGLVN